MKNKGAGLAIVLILLFIAVLGSCMGNSKSKSVGENFNNWINTDPNGWSNEQKEYFNNFMDSID